MPSRPCLEPHCADFATYRGRCAEHARLNDKSIRRAGRQVYSTKRWQVTRRKKLSLTPLCEYEGCQRIAEDVHVEAETLSTSVRLEALIGELK